MSAAAAHSEKVNDVLIDPEDLERLVQILQSCERVRSFKFEFDRSRVEIEQNIAKAEGVERLASKHSINCQPAANIGSVYLWTIQTQTVANHLRTKCTRKSVIKNGLVLREIWMQQALFLISQVLSFVVCCIYLFNNCNFIIVLPGRVPGCSHSVKLFPGVLSGEQPML